MGIGRSPAAKARAGLPRANPNDVRVKGFENHAERMSTLFRPDSSGSDPTRRGRGPGRGVPRVELPKPTRGLLGVSDEV